MDNIRKAVNFSEDYSVGPTGNQSDYFEYIFENIMAKEESGFPVSIVDLFGQWWSMYLPAEWQNGYFSDLAQLNTSFSNGTGPMPILSLAEVIPGQSPNMGNLLYPGRNKTNGFNLTEYEVTPFEFGSWVGGRVQGFMPLLYLGTAMSQGQPAGVTCVTGFDRFSFFQGATANAWNFWLIDSFYGVPLFAKRALSAILPRLMPRQDVGAPGDVVVPAADEDDFFTQFLNSTAETLQQDLNDTLWAWVPNPFQDYNEAMTGVSDLLLVDGSEAGETDPLRPLMIPQRGVDFMIVYEASADSLYSCKPFPLYEIPIWDIADSIAPREQRHQPDQLRPGRCTGRHPLPQNPQRKHHGPAQLHLPPNLFRLQRQRRGASGPVPIQHPLDDLLQLLVPHDRLLGPPAEPDPRQCV